MADNPSVAVALVTGIKLPVTGIKLIPWRHPENYKTLMLCLLNLMVADGSALHLQEGKPKVTSLWSVFIDKLWEQSEFKVYNKTSVESIRKQYNNHIAKERLLLDNSNLNKSDMQGDLDELTTVTRLILKDIEDEKNGKLARELDLKAKKGNFHPQKSKVLNLRATLMVYNTIEGLESNEASVGPLMKPPHLVRVAQGALLVRSLLLPILPFHLL
jgi:hypothetical protein